MKMDISFPGGKKVSSDFGGFKVLTDQPVKSGGDGTAPAPFDLFLSSLGTCMGFYALAFCSKHKVSADDLSLTLDFDMNKKTYMVENVLVKIELPDDFPEKLKKPLIKSVGLCAVKKHMMNPPEFTYETS
jgi:ribosomal protein S12 methylthiotransferase accessory factor